MEDFLNIDSDKHNEIVPYEGRSETPNLQDQVLNDAANEMRDNILERAPNERIHARDLLEKDLLAVQSKRNDLICKMEKYHEKLKGALEDISEAHKTINKLILQKEKSIQKNAKSLELINERQRDITIKEITFYNPKNQILMDEIKNNLVVIDKLCQNVRIEHARQSINYGNLRIKGCELQLKDTKEGLVKLESYAKDIHNEVQRESKNINAELRSLDAKIYDLGYKIRQIELQNLLV
ncbi:MAG TPA: hypothetical protein PKD85_01370 [Saprospiraceae bacterium]|nr:hypothetical protein [Saprospiraceae bacterium]